MKRNKRIKRIAAVAFIAVITAAMTSCGREKRRKAEGVGKRRIKRLLRK